MALPFITQPKSFESVIVGNDAIGTLNIKKLGSLSINERKHLKTLTADLPDLRKEAVKMARTIAVAIEAPSIVPIYTALTTGDTSYLSEHLEAVIEFQDKMDRVASDRQAALATTILTFRVDPSWTIANTGNADEIHPELVRLIAEFAASEESGWKESEPATELTEEDLGNS